MTPATLFSATMAIWLAPLALAWLDGPRTHRTTWSVLLGLGALALLALACNAPASGLILTLTPPFSLGAVPVQFLLDPVAGWFLAVIALAALPLACYLPAYLEHLEGRCDLRLFWGPLSLLLCSMAMVVMAANALTFVIAWELMSFSSFVLVATDHAREANRNAALVYLGATRVGTAFLVGGFLWAHAVTGSWAFEEWRLSGANAFGPGLLVLVALGVKAGMWPFHLWLPVAHPAAPSPVSALMSGVMVKVAVYMMVRLFLVQHAFDHPAFGGALALLGAISAFWGVAFALLQHDLKRLLAYHTVENVGLILMGVGGSLVAERLGHPDVARLALAAALFHTLNHALFKSLLFLGAGAVDMQVHTRDLEHLGGLGRLMPWTFACFVLGSAAICGLPPLNGFASEWLLYQGALGLGMASHLAGVRYLALIGIGWIALVGALALACFVKACGVAFLGRPRSPAMEQAAEVPRGMILAQVLLAGACAALGLLAPAVLDVLHPVVAFLHPEGPPLAEAWLLPMPTLVAVLAAGMGIGWLWMKRAATAAPARIYITWECGFGDLTGRMQATATSFVQPIARMFGALFRYAVHLRIDGANRRLFPEQITVEPHTEAVLESRVYEPLWRLLQRMGDGVVRLQTGSIHLYLLTMFLTLILLLYVGGRGL